jgi:hypothetical protein
MPLNMYFILCKPCIRNKLNSFISRTFSFTVLLLYLVNIHMKEYFNLELITRSRTIPSVLPNNFPPNPIIPRHSWSPKVYDRFHKGRH